MFKKLIPLLIIVVLLAVGSIIKKQSMQRQFNLVEEIGATTILPENFLISDVSKIDLYLGSKADQKVTLVKENNEWLIPTSFQAPGDKNAIEKFLDTLKNMLGEKRNAPKDFLSDFNLQDSEAVHIELTRNNTKDVSHILVGKKDGNKACFIRMHDSDNIYRIGQDLREAMGIWGNDKAPEHIQWLYKKIVKLNKDDLKQIKITYPQKSFTFSHEKREKETKDAEKETKDSNKDEYYWALKEGGATLNFAIAELESLIDTIIDLDGTDVLDPKKKAEFGLDKPNYSLEITLNNGTTKILYAVKAEKEGYCYLNTNENLVYKLDNWTFNSRLFKKGSKYFVLPSMTLDHHSIKNIQYTLPQGEFLLNRIAFGEPSKERVSWVLQKPEGKYIPQTENLNTAMGHLSRLQAEDYIDEKSLEQFNLQHPHYALHITMKDDTTHTIKASIQNDTYYLVLDDQMPIVTLQATDFTKIFPKFEDMFKIESVEEKLEEMPIMPEALENLEEAPKATTEAPDTTAEDTLNVLESITDDSEKPAPIE